MPLHRRPSTLAVRLARILSVIVAAALFPAIAHGQGAASGTPVLGKSLLSPAQIAEWYAATGVRSTSPTDPRTLASIFVAEGDAQGVRGDLAFAQSMLETGYLRYGGQVLPSDNNFSGLGACDSCRRGLAFASATLGVRAQIQHLWAYASPTASVATLAHPNADIRFDLVQPKGKAPLWEDMGGGNWATDPHYARKVLTIYRDMLRSAGITLPQPTTAPAAAPMVRTLRTTTSGGGWIGGWAPHRSRLSGAVDAFGPPESSRRAGRVCLMRWPSIGLAVLGHGATPCEADRSSARWVRLTRPLWRTSRGLAVGDSVQRLNRLYPRTRTRGAQRWLVWGRDPGTRTTVPRLRAEIRNGRVRALIVSTRPPAPAT